MKETKVGEKKSVSKAVIFTEDQATWVGVAASLSGRSAPAWLHDVSVLAARVSISDDLLVELSKRGLIGGGIDVEAKRAKEELISFLTKAEK